MQTPVELTIAEAEEALAVEVERRISEIENGTVKVIPMHEALAQVRASIKRVRTK